MRSAAAGLGLVAGVATQVWWPVLPVAEWALAGALLAALAAVAGGLGPPGNGRSTPGVAALVAGVGIGIFWATRVGASVLAAHLPPALEDRPLELVGEVRSQRVHADGSMTWMIDVRALPWTTAAGRWQVRLSSADGAALAVGERWSLPVRLRRPRAALNPGAADFSRWMLGQRVVATGWMRRDVPPRRLAPAQGFAAARAQLLAAAMPLTGAATGALAASEAERFARAVLPALVVDERSLVSPEHWRVLAATGTAHLVAISGLHVALLWGAVLVAGAALTRRPLPAQRYRPHSVLPALALAAGYAALAGAPLPAVRAVIMLALASWWLLRAGQVPAWRVLLLATVTVLLVDPLAVHDAGFWLSHGAVACLLLLADLRRRTARHPVATLLRESFRVQVLLTLWLAPVLLALFGSASVSSVPANLLAVPLVNFVVLPAALAGFALAPLWPGGADLAIDLATGGLAWLWHLLVWLDRLPALAPLTAAEFTSLSAPLLTLALVACVLVRVWSLRLAALLVVVLAWPVPPPAGARDARVCVLDVGQGLAVLVRTARHALLYDTGPAWGEADAGGRVVVPAARALGIGRLDLLVLSHHDRDHVGGAEAVMAALRPRTVLAGDPRSLPAPDGTLCRPMWRRRYDGVEVEVLPGDPQGDDNDRSCVLRLAAGSRALLVPGDISRRAELALAARHGTRLAADVLVAAHHGSRSSGSETFLLRVAPRDVLYSAGYRNRFGHPHPEVQARVRRLGARQQATAEAGALCFVLQPDGPPRVEAARARRRWWRD